MTCFDRNGHHQVLKVVGEKNATFLRLYMVPLVHMCELMYH
jgi:hypothetical protein